MSLLQLLLKKQSVFVFSAPRFWEKPESVWMHFLQKNSTEGNRPPCCIVCSHYNTLILILAQTPLPSHPVPVRPWVQVQP